MHSSPLLLRLRVAREECASACLRRRRRALACLRCVGLAPRRLRACGRGAPGRGRGSGWLFCWGCLSWLVVSLLVGVAVLRRGCGCLVARVFCALVLRARWLRCVRVVRRLCLVAVRRSRRRLPWFGFVRRPLVLAGRLRCRCCVALVLLVRSAWCVRLGRCRSLRFCVRAGVRACSRRCGRRACRLVRRVSAPSWFLVVLPVGFGRRVFGWGGVGEAEADF